MDGREFRATQEFVVCAPQFTLDPSQVVNQCPPPGSTGQFGEVLPHIVLKDPTFPWEREMDAAKDAPRTPWVALMVFAENELLTDGTAGGKPNPGRVPRAVQADVRAEAGPGT